MAEWRATQDVTQAGMAAPAPVESSSSLGSVLLESAQKAPSSSSLSSSSGKKKRRRPALSCEQCRRRKIRCDRLQPCCHCLKAKIPDCSYAPTHIPASWVKKAQAAQVHAHASSREPVGAGPRRLSPSPPPATAAAPPPQPSYSITAASTLAPAPGPPSKPSTMTRRAILPTPLAGWAVLVPSQHDEQATHDSSSTQQPPADTLLGRPSPAASCHKDWTAAMHYLEDKLTQVVNISNKGSPASPREEEDPSVPAKGNSSKTRYYGRSHWLKCTTLLVAEQKLLISQKHENGEFWQLMSACKHLGRAIKEKRMQPLSSLELGRRIPSRDVADQLVEAYLRTFEGVLRVLHVPTFRSDYEKYWQSPETAHDYFIIQLQLVMALGAAMQDDLFSMRSLASHWLHEAQLWLILPPEKSRLTVAGIQIMCLLIQARSVCAVGHDLAWISAGALVRKAIYMGLHRDPRSLQPKMTTYRAEMRRRLWATIMELNLQSSFDAGGPVLLSAADYDVLPPANLDDEDLGDEPDAERVMQQAMDTVTSMSIPLELLQSYPLRLAILKHVNDFRVLEDYDETLRLNSDLTKACRILSKNLSTLTKGQEASPTNVKINDFHTKVAELYVYRCFNTLHQHFVAKSLDDPKLYFSRKMYLDSSLKVMNICGLSGPGRATGPGGGDDVSATSDFHRLMVNGSGVFRNIPLQCVPGIIFELTLTADGEIYGGSTATDKSSGSVRPLGLGYFPSMGDYDLHATVSAATKWLLRRIRSGETNIKGYVCCGTGQRHIAALDAGITDEAAIATEIRKGAEELIREGHGVLRNLAIREGIQLDGSSSSSGGSNTMSSLDTANTAELIDVTATAGPAAANELQQEDEMMGMDFMGDWVWDDMDYELWGPPRPFSGFQAGPSMFG